MKPELEVDDATWEARMAIRRITQTASYEDLADASVEAARPVIERELRERILTLHHQSTTLTGLNYCRECYDKDRNGWALWPCKTAALLGETA